MQEYLLGIDAGTTSFKAAIFDMAGKPVCIRGRDYTLLTNKVDTVEFPPEEYWEILCGLLHELIYESGINPRNIASLAVSSQGETLVCLGNDGKPVCNAIVWSDNRAFRESDEIRAYFSRREVYEHTGQPDVTATWTACKILWLKKNEPYIFNKTKKFLLLEDYIIYRLTGKAVCEPSLLASSLLFDVRNLCWWNDMLSYIGINQDRLGEVASCGSPAGRVTEAAAGETGLAAGTLVSTGALDQICGIMGAGITKPGVVTESTGSCLAVTAGVDRFIEWDESMPVTCQAHAITGRYVIMQWCQTAGMALKWFANAFYEQKTGADFNLYRFIDEEASAVPPGCDGLIMLPHLLGAHSPEYDLNAKGVFFGITPGHGRGHFARAILEAVGFMLRRNLEQLQSAGVDFNGFYSFGGGSRSALWNTIKADITGCEVKPMAVTETACLGAAILAGKACGAIADIDEAAKKFLHTNTVYAPNHANRAVYDELYGNYIRLYNALKPVFNPKN